MSHLHPWLSSCSISHRRKRNPNDIRSIRTRMRRSWSSLERRWWTRSCPRFWTIYMPKPGNPVSWICLSKTTLLQLLLIAVFAFLSFPLFFSSTFTLILYSLLVLLCHAYFVCFNGFHWFHPSEFLINAIKSLQFWQKESLLFYPKIRWRELACLYTWMFIWNVSI